MIDDLVAVLTGVGDAINDGVGAKFAALAAFTMFTEIQGVYPIREFGNVFRVIKHKPGFKIAPVGILRTHAGAREVGRSDKGQHAINHDGFGVYARAEYTFKELTVPQGWVAIKVVAKPWARILRVNQSDRDAALYQL